MTDIILNDAINFVNDKTENKKLREIEEFFALRLKEKEGLLDQECECLFYLLRVKLKKHSYFETLDCKKIRDDFIRKTKELEVKTRKEYKNSAKGQIEKAQMEAFYKMMEHYYSALQEDYNNLHFLSKEVVYKEKMDYRRKSYFFDRKIGRWVTYFLFHLTSFYGTSMVRWFITSLTTIVIFGFVFSVIDEFSVEKLIDIAAGDHWYDYFYHSIVTFTTLGYGDIVPYTALQKSFVALEVMTGYSMLGVFMTLLAKKV